ncbi:MAG: hypothetical protein BGO49_26055 [Planctomycetales bacterium 71-10]|nr:MAG: hypothetical protein BGO49_26055 [Planctomycetales bacterium 71-10]
MGVDWAGGAWTFAATGGRAGLVRDGAAGPFLCLTGLAVVGRRDDAAFTADSLVGLDVVHGRLLATFEPSGWHGLTVRAGWTLCRDGRGMELEIQASADSVGELRRLEIMAETRPRGLTAKDGAEPQWTVEPRDRWAAGSTYDGREPDALLKRLTTLPVGAHGSPPEHPDFGSLCCDPDVGFRGSFFEIARPDDVARTITTKQHAAEPIRYAFFGFDLEKGVVLRGRLRVVSLDESADWRDERDRFLAEPPPLRTD